ncbi:hypothetical protein DFS33DRAFT_999240 [Desarmillaria ectypa]|nr:hypothetical protein DFS33DRAFT_999240 [Desarmillaria ectypa]
MASRYIIFHVHLCGPHLHMAPCIQTTGPESPFTLAFEIYPRLAIIFCIFAALRLALYPRLPPLTPRTVVQHLTETVDKTLSLYDGHSRTLGDLGFCCKMRMFNMKSRALSRKLQNAEHALCWMNHLSWIPYMSNMHQIWKEARRYQHQVDALKKDIEDAIFYEEGKLFDDPHFRGQQLFVIFAKNLNNVTLLKAEARDKVCWPALFGLSQLLQSFTFMMLLAR